jgi:hypothetical protein
METLVGSKPVVIAICVALIVAFAFVQYVHRGYVGATGTQMSPRVLRPGFHVRPPWAHVTYYPVFAHEVAIKTDWEGSRGKCRFDLTLQLSVTPDSVASLHRAYGGRYVESLITPLVADFLLSRGTSGGAWGPEAEEAGKALGGHLNTVLNPYGVYIYYVEIRTFEVQANLKATIQ